MTAPQTEQREMKVGRELDALIAEKVMGAKWVRDAGRQTGKWYQRLYLNHLILAEQYEGHGTVYCGPPILPRYSTDIAAAWEVVERLAPRFDFYLRRVSTWTAEFSEVDSSSDLVIGWHAIGGTADGETAPLAICLAALKAVQS